MKTTTIKALFSVALTAALVSACSTESGTNQRSAPELAKKTAGPAGAISIDGVLVKKEDENLVLDSRILVEEGSIRPQLSENVDAALLSEVVPDRGYLVLGCEEEQLAEHKDLFEGLEPLSAPMPNPDDGSFSVKAHTLIFCEGVSFPYKNIAFTAKNMIFVNGRFSSLEDTGSITWTAENLILVGENGISAESHCGENSTQGPALAIHLTKSLQGEGRLSLRSVSGSCEK